MESLAADPETMVRTPLDDAHVAVTRETPYETSHSGILVVGEGSVVISKVRDHANAMQEPATTA